ncbi:YeiH family protein [Thalassomonas haliotis]|uniref:Sulfate exporter family transporter n=1 Tax=Thalassomonas haliotis TaxID=485448 RepID=A0ABY7VB50_9GAMM|nr:putative sulfate exporter family transporter [Thalassomonas haliotis]WDE10756.1 putative sulfate exporter family transporter [Thalassomonas haliotis]
MLAFIKSHYAGLFVCAVIAIAASALAHRYQAPVMLFALLLGLALHFLYEAKSYQPGIDFCSKTVLRFAVALLGVRIAFADIVSLGLMPPLIVVGSMGLTIFFGILLARLLGLPKVFGVLSGGAVAVCGVSAAAAISTVLPKKAHQEKFFALTVISITALSTLAMLTYPLVTDFLKLSDEQAGVFIGGAIHDVAQVVGAGYSVSTEAGDIATYIKLLRVALLLPIVVMIFFAFKEKSSRLSAGVSSFIPGFLIAFFILALVNNLGFIPAPLVDMVKSISGGALVVSMVAIGIKTSLKQVVSVGWKPVFLMTLETVFFALLILAGIFFIG